MRYLMGLAVAMGLLAGPLAAQDTGEGEALYTHHCAMCHGIDATGRGPLSPVLTIQPTDLTALAAGNGGVLAFFQAATRSNTRYGMRRGGSPNCV